MKSLHLKLGRIKMFAIKTIINLISVRSVSILIISLCVGILLSCSAGDVGSPEVNISAGGFKPSKSLTGTLGNGEGSIALSTVNGNIEVIGFD